MKRGLLALAFVLIVGVSAIFILTKKGASPAPTNGKTDSGTSALQKNINLPPSKPGTITANITYTNDGFAPKTVAARVGDVIEVINQSSKSLQFSSDPHPAHTTNSELNQSTIPAKGRQTFTVTKKGVFGFHNQLDSRKSGTLVVE